jgi:CheY-like chemotaxis protein
MSLTLLAPSIKLNSNEMSTSGVIPANAMLASNAMPTNAMPTNAISASSATPANAMSTNAISAILCVDDEVIILDSLREQLERHFGDDYVYEVAENVKEAWWIIEDLCENGVRVLVIVSDWLMPGIRGDEFLVQVHQRFPQIVTIMLTGQAETEAIERARSEANLRACLRKPWREEELIDLVSSALL